MRNSEIAYKNRPKKWIMNTVFSVAMAVAFVYSFSGSTINLLRLTTFKYTLKQMAKGFADIHWNFMLGTGEYAFQEGIVFLGLQTLAIAFIGTLIGSILAIPFSFLASTKIAGKKASHIGVVLLVLIRVFPEIVLAIIIVKGFGITPLACVITIGIHSVGMLGKLFSESIDNMDNGPIEALDASGANIWQKIRFGIMPQIIPELASVSLYRFDINLRSASVLGVVGSSAGGFGAQLLLASSQQQWDNLATILVPIVLLILAVDMISTSLRKKLV